MRWFICAALAVLLVACGGSDDKKSPSPVPPDAGNDEGRPNPKAPQLIYATTTRVLPPQSHSFIPATKTIYSIDLQTGKRYELVTYGGIPGEGLAAASVHGKYMVYATSKVATRADVDGRNPQEIFRVPPGQGYDNIKDIELSPDGTRLAVLQWESFYDGNGGTIIFIETASGRELSRLTRKMPAFDAFEGNFAWLQWRADSSAIVVIGFINPHQTGSVATISPNGSVKVHGAEGWTNVSPSGDLVADGPFAECAGLSVAGNKLRIRDVASGRVVASVGDGVKLYTPWTWSPDGSEFLYLERTMGANSECPVVSYRLLTPRGGDTPVSNLAQVYDRWYGKRLVTLRCDGEEKPAFYRPGGKQRVDCNSGIANQMAPIELRLAHKTVDVLQPGYQEVEVLGFLNY